MENRPTDYDYVKAMHGEYDQKSEGPSLRVTVAETLMGRIGDLAKQVTDAAHMLHEARDQYQRAAAQRQKAEAAFAEVSDMLARALHEHREGAPENHPYHRTPAAHDGVPYQP